MIEAVSHLARQGPLRIIEGILNGTCNYVLDQLSQGVELPEAIALARACGIAEANPALDLDGTDAAHKLVILARVGFGNPEITVDERTGINAVDSSAVRRAASMGKIVRLVAFLRREDRRLTARVAPSLLDRDHPLAQVRGQNNALLVETASGQRHFLHGKGAGRWPTAEAIIADLMTLIRAHRRSFRHVKPSQSPQSNQQACPSARAMAESASHPVLEPRNSSGACS
jgi:homoserine dehydrogenase